MIDRYMFISISTQNNYINRDQYFFIIYTDTRSIQIHIYIQHDFRSVSPRLGKKYIYKTAYK